LKYINKFKIHSQFIFPLREKFIHTNFDLSSGWRAKNSRNPNKTFYQLISNNKNFTEKLDIYIDGSKFLVEQRINKISCAIFPQLNLSYSYKLNFMTSSYMAKALAIDKVVDLIKSQAHVNILSDFLSLLETLKNSETVLFPSVLNSA